MKMLSPLATLLLTTFIVVNAFTQSPYLSATQNFLDNVDRKTCIERAAAALAINNMNVSTKGEEHCFGSNQEFSVGIFCDWCGSVVNVNISVATNGNGASTDLLRDRILEYIATGSNTGGGTAGGEAMLWLDKNKFEPGESVSVHFKAPGTFAANAWVGILPANIEHGSEAKNDGYELTYQYLNKRTSGTLTFTAPNQKGSYDFRLNDTDDNGKEVAYVVFSVGTAADPGGEASLKLDKTVFAPGESITVHFTASANFAANAWVGMLPANIEHGSEAKNDGYELTYQYLNKRTSGTLTFTAPNQKGSYDFRLNDTDDNGKEVAYVVFSVGTAADPGGEASLKLDKTVFAPGESITVQFIASALYAADAWVGIIPSNIEHGSEAKNDQYDLTYQYLNKRTTGSLTFAAPAQKGNFDLRMHDTDSNGKEVASVSFRVE